MIKNKVLHIKIILKTYRNIETELKTFLILYKIIYNNFQKLLFIIVFENTF